MLGNTGQIFTTPQSSTLTAQGMISNTIFHEEDLILAIPATGRIVKITCNYGEVVSAEFAPLCTAGKNSNRGRKPKIKKRTNRKRQGSGKYFNSQITFWISSILTEHKYYKIKLFRNGTVEIPGGLKPDMSDVREVVGVLVEVLRECFQDDDIHVTSLYPIMINYKFKMFDDSIRINLPALHSLLIEISTGDSTGIADILEIKYNSERYPGLILKYRTPTERNAKKQTTIKIFKGGKINIDGAVSSDCVISYHSEINLLFGKYRERILYTVKKEQDISSDSSGE